MAGTRTILAALMALALTAPAFAQAGKPVQTAKPASAEKPAAAEKAGNPLTGGGGGKGPVSIEADSLEVRDKDKMAVFNGNVIVTRGTTTMRASHINVMYRGEVQPGAVASGGAAGKAGQNIRSIEMQGPILVSQPGQQATADRGTYDAATETVMLEGNVVLSQGNNVLKGPKLFIDLKTNRARMDGRVKGILVPSETPNAAPKR
jgi:lipopolysaccharide export system protein LptA